MDVQPCLQANCATGDQSFGISAVSEGLTQARSDLSVRRRRLFAARRGGRRTGTPLAQRLRALRSDLIESHNLRASHGRIVKRTGDGSVIEFRSVVGTQ